MAERRKYDITVTPKAAYIEDQSDPSKNRYVFAYTITISNTGEVAAQLVSRHWIITDAADHTREVKGLGVVGQQPVLEPGESFKYSSWCPLETPVGMMHGSYQMVRENGEGFEIEIAPFALKARYTVN